MLNMLNSFHFQRSLVRISPSSLSSKIHHPPPSTGVLTSKLICLRLSDYLQKKNLMSLTNLRKTFQFFSMIIPAICFLIIPIKGDNQNIVTALIFVGMFG